MPRILLKALALFGMAIRRPLQLGLPPPTRRFGCRDFYVVFSDAQISSALLPQADHFGCFTLF